MRLNKTPRQDVGPETERWYRQIANQVNRLSEGRMSANYAAMTSAPTGGAWAQGDEVRNSAPTELGTAGSKYTVRGWLCVASGTPGTWVEQRNPTGA